MSEVFEFVKADSNKAILKVKELSTLMIAEHPYLNSKMDYITITRGRQHTMTIINKDGSTWSVNWGDRGCTLCSDSVDDLKWAARDFFQLECGVLLDLTTDNSAITEASVFYNNNLQVWQLRLKTDYWTTQNLFFKDCKNKDEVMIKANQYIGDRIWKYERAQTGIDTWVADMRGAVNV